MLSGRSIRKWTVTSKSGPSLGQSERCKRLKLKRRKLCRSDENKGVKVDGLSDESGRSSWKHTSQSRRSFEPKRTILWVKAHDPSFDKKQTILVKVNDPFTLIFISESRRSQPTHFHTKQTILSQSGRSFYRFYRWKQTILSYIFVLIRKKEWKQTFPVTLKFE